MSPAMAGASYGTALDISDIVKLIEKWETQT
jgi:hypothetical protein